MEPMVIVGGGLAGGKAAARLRKKGYDGEIVLVTNEQTVPYERPPLSKDYLQGKSSREAMYVNPADWYTENRVDLRLETTAKSIDPAARSITLSGGDTLKYHRLLLATGSSPRLLDTGPVDPDRVFYLRRMEDSDRLKTLLGSAGRIVIIGAGWIGLEVAAAARLAGVEVTVLEKAELPLLRVLGRECSEVFAALHRDHGVDFRFGADVTGFDAGADGAVQVRLGDGGTVTGEGLVVGVGITPNVGLAQEAGLDVENGILVDEHLRTSNPDIFAAGDVANAWHPVLQRRLRVEHWFNALHQPTVAAANMADGPGGDAVYDRLPYFYTDQYDLGMEYVGYVDPGAYDKVVFRGDRDKREFIAFWMAGGKVLAGMNVNIWDVADDVKAIILAGNEVDEGKLADPDVPLKDLAG